MKHTWVSSRSLTVFSLFVSHSQAGSTRSSLDYAVMVQSASGIEADINQGLSWEKMKLRNNFTGVARLLGTSLLLTCLTLHTIIQSMMQYSYVDQTSLKISKEGD